MDRALNGNSKKTRPSISHILPIKDGQDFVAQIMPNILENTLPGDEIIVIEDGSKDSTFSSLEVFKSIYKNIKIIRTGGLGIVAALNLGLQESNCEWIARYDADDRYSINRIASQIKVIQEDTVAVFADYDLYIGGTKYAGTIPSPVTPLATLLSLQFSQQTAHPVALIRRAALLNVGGYLESELPTEDLGLWLRLATVGKLISVPEILLQYSVGKKSLTGLNYESMKEKTKTLVNEFDWRSALSDIGVKELINEFEYYKNVDFTFIRQLLFLRSIKRAQNLNLIPIRNLQIWLLYFRLILNFEPFSFIKFVYFFALRRFSRLN